MLELIIIIVVITLAAAYVARSFYRKFRRGKPQGPGCDCSGCDCSAGDNCHPGSIDGGPPGDCPDRKNR